MVWCIWQKCWNPHNSQFYMNQTENRCTTNRTRRSWSAPTCRHDAKNFFRTFWWAIQSIPIIIKTKQVSIVNLKMWAQILLILKISLTASVRRCPECKNFPHHNAKRPDVRFGCENTVSYAFNRHPSPGHFTWVAYIFSWNWLEYSTLLVEVCILQSR